MKRHLFAVGLVVVLLSAFALTGTSFAAGTPTDPVVTSLFCTLHIEFDAPAAGVEYLVEVWDDGVLVFSDTGISTAAGQTFHFSFDFTNRTIGQLIPGLGLVLYADGSLAWRADPYTGLDEGCLAFQGNEPGCDVLAPLPKTAVVASFVQTEPLYSAPGVLDEPALSIEAGKTAWAIGPDASGKYYKILWVCDFLWVPASALGPNYDNVWQGTPLPNAPVS